MKTPPEHDELLNEVLSDDLRATSLERTLSALRRERRLRHTLRGTSLLALVGVITVIVWHQQKPAPQPVAAIKPAQPAPASPSASTVPGTSIRVVSDEELLAMFPGRPIALMGPPGNRQFVFLDEQRVAKSHGPAQPKG